MFKKKVKNLGRSSRYGIYAIYDSVGREFSLPFFQLSDDLAKREFKVVLAHSAYREDLFLYRLGSFNTLPLTIIKEDSKDYDSFLPENPNLFYDLKFAKLADCSIINDEVVNGERKQN